MNVLAIETSTAVCEAAVVREGSVLSNSRLSAPHVHSEKLIPLIDEALRGAGMTIPDLDGIAISIGPGSFTGLRIGLSVAKGLSFASGKPLVPVSTLKALAMQAVRYSFSGPGDLVLPLIDARRAEVYAAAYRNENGILEEVLPPHAALVSGLAAAIPQEGKVTVMGDGAEKFLEHITRNDSRAASRCTSPPADLRLCSAVTVGHLGEQELAAGRSADTASLEPMYVKDFHSLVTIRRAEVES